MIKVVCAILEQHKRVLVTQRSAQMSQPLLWEFPGGKLEPGETEEEGLVRELKEELNLTIVPLIRLTPVLHTYGNRRIELIPYLCHYGGGFVELREHRAYQWATHTELLQYAWCPADIPIMEEFLSLRHSY